VLREQPFTDPATIETLQQCQAASQPVSPEHTAPRQPPVARHVYHALQHTWQCDRCGARFTDGANAPSACCFHPGVLFSGMATPGQIRPLQRQHNITVLPTAQMVMN
jgi:hypothetical protein